MIDGNSGASPAPVRFDDARAVELAARFGRRLELFATRHLAPHLADDVLGLVGVQLREGRVSLEDTAASVLATARAMVARHRRAGALVRDGRCQRNRAVPTERLRRAFEALPEAERTIALLTFYAERSADEIAEVVALPTLRIRELRERALAGLRGCLEECPAVRSTNLPLPAFGELVDYWLGELEETRARAIEELLFTEDVVVAEIDRLARIGAGLSERPLPGPCMAVTAQALDTMEDQGLRLRAYRVEPGEPVPATLGDEPFVVVRLRGAFEGAAEVDLQWRIGDGSPTLRGGMLVDASASELVLLHSADALRGVPACRMSYRVWSREAAPRRLGEFHLDYTPPSASRDR